MRSNALYRGIRRDVGGDHLANPRSFLLFVPIWMLGSLVGLPNLESASAISMAVFANIVGFVAALAALLGLRATLYRNRLLTPIALWKVLAGGAVVGVVKAMVTLSLLDWIVQEGEYWQLFPFRAVIAGLTGATFVPLAAYLAATRERINQARQLITAEWFRQSSFRLENLPLESRVKLDELVREATLIATKTGVDPSLKSTQLTDFLDTKLRPFIHQLWEQSSATTHRDRSLFTLRAALGQHSVSSWVTTCGVGILSAEVIISTTGWPEGVSRLAIMCATAFLAVEGWRRLRVTGPIQSTSALIGSAVLYSVVNEAIATAIFGSFGSLPAVGAVIVNSTVYFTIAIVSGMVTMSRREIRDIRMSLDSLLGVGNWSWGRVGELNRLTQRELASVLHGKFQNGLLNLALALRREPGEPSEHRAQELINQLRQFLSARPERFGSMMPGDLQERLAHLATQWAGIVSVELRLEHSRELRPVDEDFLFHVCEEAITNSSRHGLADLVTLSSRDDGHFLELQVLDNGLGPRAGHPGLGTHLYGSHPDVSWELGARDSHSGALLTLRLMIF